MGIRERLAQLEATRGGPHIKRRHYGVWKLEGQSDEEAWQLSQFSGVPISQCLFIPESYLRQLYFEVDGNYNWAEKTLADLRAQHDAIRQGRLDLAPFPDWFRDPRPGYEDPIIAPGILARMRSGAP